MNVDLNKALEAVQEYFPKASISENVIECRKTELSPNDVLNIQHVSSVRQKDGVCLFPWVFRSGKEVKLVFFIKPDANQEYLTSHDKYAELEDSEGGNWDVSIIQAIDDMCNQSVSPEVNELWASVRMALIFNRRLPIEIGSKP